MVYHGRIQNGVIVLDTPADLPEGSRVTVQPETGPHEVSLAESLGDLIGKAKGLPPDFAENHDHYIHGAPKK